MFGTAIATSEIDTGGHYITLDNAAVGEILTYNGTNAVWSQVVGADEAKRLGSSIIIPNTGNVKGYRVNSRAKTVEFCVDDIVNIFETETQFIFMLSLITNVTACITVTKNEDTPDYHMMVYKRPSDWKKVQKNGKHY